MWGPPVHHPGIQGGGRASSGSHNHPENCWRFSDSWMVDGRAPQAMTIPRMGRPLQEGAPQCELRMARCTLALFKEPSRRGTRFRSELKRPLKGRRPNRPPGDSSARREWYSLNATLSKRMVFVECHSLLASLVHPNCNLFRASCARARLLFCARATGSTTLTAVSAYIVGTSGRGRTWR